MGVAPIPAALRPDEAPRHRRGRTLLVTTGIVVLLGVGAATVPVPGLTATREGAAPASPLAAVRPITAHPHRTIDAGTARPRCHHHPADSLPDHSRPGGTRSGGTGSGGTGSDHRSRPDRQRPAGRGGRPVTAVDDRPATGPFRSVPASPADPPARTGSSAPAISPESAESAALAGDLDTALRQADVLLHRADDDAGRARGAVVLAAVLPHRGLLARSAEVHRWIAVHAPAAGDAGAAVALLGTGALDEGRRAAAPCRDPFALPGLRDTAGALVAQGILASVDGDGATALSLLVRAVTALSACDRPGPTADSPAALYALLALHRGEPELVGPVLDLAVGGDLGGAAMRRRHLVLRAWTAMASGGPEAATAARAGLDAAAAVATSIEPRDELVTVALEVALARRAGDTRRLLDLWSRARQALLRHPVDLYTLLPVGELAIAAARLGEGAWVAPHVAEATSLLEALEHPASWSTAWHWARLHAALAGPAGTVVDLAEAAVHAEALARAAEVNVRAAAPARAATVWLRVQVGDVDPDEVAAAATALGRAGLAWDGARLAGEAAVRTTDRKAMTALLARARSLTPGSTTETPSAAAGATDVTTAPPSAPAPSCAPAPPSAPASSSTLGTAGGEVRLTAREQEIALLVLEGLTQREIAGRLFLSAKTVEHHVARIKQRLGSVSRADLFTQLRALLQR